jgi:hypothetical protein
MLFHQLNHKAMKILLAVFIAFISISVHSQYRTEKILEDGTHCIVYVPIPGQFSEEELANCKPRRIPTTAEVQKNPLILLSNLFMKNLESTFKVNVEEDSSLVAASDKNFMNHLGLTDSKSDCQPVRYHQIWELKESVVNYNFYDFSQSLVDMIKSNHLDSYLEKSIQFYCKEYFYNDKYYLVAIIND